MSKIVESIDVDVPVRVAYDQWTQFEEFPRFMDGVKRVRQLNDTTIEWNAEINGIDRSWRAEITEQEPDTAIAWRSTSGAKNDGRISFEPLDGDRARATLELEVEPDDPIEKAGDALGFGFSLSQRRQQHSCENCNDGNHNEQFNKCKGAHRNSWSAAMLIRE